MNCVLVMYIDVRLRVSTLTILLSLICILQGGVTSREGKGVEIRMGQYINVT